MSKERKEERRKKKLLSIAIGCYVYILLPRRVLWQLDRLSSTIKYYNIDLNIAAMVPNYNKIRLP